MREPASTSTRELLRPEALLDVAHDAGRDYARWRVRLAGADGESLWIRLFEAGDISVWALSWSSMPPGTAYLDHEGVRGAVFVARGSLLHERARLGCAPHPEEVGAGQGFCFDENFYHRMHAVGDAGPTVTVHVFASADLKRVGTPDQDALVLGFGLP
ncbi:hypothetical protein ACFT0G_28620 [Streptomyces sp. NPDC057020]|uniref:hypothetical protein n=1 Tax=unclassified Streptomyces TaxID=2593676 RepID=UPI00093B9D98|nr:hypothetical protein [Streptomyces sp. CB02009]OKJ65341.1 hypothetical protein AMK27_06105 [Streptomyces sp. CB02009]